ncbi:excalibur calcium-binding domain-containing protein [Mumia sp. zg.B53]|uniref:excalibur calcium-binding domain-containing protein n=1 Tax=Mumia sp. zg.B53 TaxID=2855449 RepID=UPI001C6F21D3|nr:excalibur calcium-binding domain-containing protein [Mumia sp. zg.B53]MBW9215508.1 excalibur calcium-binding domain-containing protein [Mumia sp. zg.B53]
MKNAVRALALVGCLALIGAGLSSASATPVPTATPSVADAKRASTISAKTLLKRLTVRSETRAGYARAKFGRGWKAQGKGCDTRAVVLRSESRSRTTQTRNCTIKRGKWRSQYDGRVVRRASKLDIDHRVPLAEAWDSGAKKWTKKTRIAYANDLGYAESLVAVTARSNRAKGDGDIAQWLPSKSRCSYTARYVAVKYRWRLAVDKREKRAITRVFSRCGRRGLKVAKPGRASVKTGGNSAPAPPPSSNDPRFGTCGVAIAHGYGPYYRGRDPEYSWYIDRDRDGIVCER